MKDFVRGFLDEESDARERAEADKNSLVLPLTDDSFDEATKKYPLFVVEFFAPWCPHCKKAAPHMEEAAKQPGHDRQAAIEDVGRTWYVVRDHRTVHDKSNGIVCRRHSPHSRLGG